MSPCFLPSTRFRIERLFFGSYYLSFVNLGLLSGPRFCTEQLFFVLYLDFVDLGFFFSTIDYRFCNDYFVLCPRVFWARGSVVSRFLFLYLDFLDLGIYFFSTFVFRIDYFERCNSLFAATTQQTQRRRCPGSPGKWPLYYLTFEHGWSFNAELCDWAYWQSREHKSLSKCDWDGAVCASPRSVHLRLLSAQRCCCSSDARWEARALSYPAITREVPYARAPLC